MLKVTIGRAKDGNKGILTGEGIFTREYSSQTQIQTHLFNDLDSFNDLKRLNDLNWEKIDPNEQEKKLILDELDELCTPKEIKEVPTDRGRYWIKVDTI